MATPNYQGRGQPAASSGGWLGGLGTWFGGGSTPAYAGKGQPSSTSSAYFGGSTPAYKPAANSAATPNSAEVIGPGPITVVIPREVIEQLRQQELSSGSE